MLSDSELMRLKCYNYINIIYIKYNYDILKAILEVVISRGNFRIKK